jgi:hypothetical protein
MTLLTVVIVRSSNIVGNVLQLGEVAEIEAQMFSFVQKFNRRTAVEFSTEPAILPNCCVCPECTSYHIPKPKTKQKHSVFKEKKRSFEQKSRI